MEAVTKQEYISMMKETPAESVEFMIRKLKDIPDDIRNAQTVLHTQEIIEKLYFLRDNYLNEILNDLERLESQQTIILPDLIDLDHEIIKS